MGRRAARPQRGRHPHPGVLVTPDCSKSAARLNTQLLPVGDGAVEYLTVGEGEPVTLFAHGLSGSIDETRPLASGVHGTRAFFHFRGHGATTSPPGPWSYDDLAGELAAMADHVGATRVLGASMGAGAILSLLGTDPHRFERVVLFLPAVLDWLPEEGDPAYERLDNLAAAVEDADVDRLTELMLTDQPAGVREMPVAVNYMRDRAEHLVGTNVAQAIRTIPRTTPIGDRTALKAVTTPVLVIAQDADPVHQASVAEDIAAALPNARLQLFDEASAIWLARDKLRDLIAGFLNG